MGPSQADPVGDVVWLHLVNTESKKLKAVIYALFHSHGTKFRTQAEPKDQAGNTYFGGETLGKAVTISERPSPAPGALPVGGLRPTSCLHQRGPERREFSSGPPGGRTAHWEHWELRIPEEGCAGFCFPSVLLDQTAHHPSQNPPRWPESDAPSEKEVPGPDPTQSHLDAC